MWARCLLQWDPRGEGTRLDDKPNAPMTPEEYVEAMVLPTLHEALAARDDRRRAYLACLVVCHGADSLGLAPAARDPGFAALEGRPRNHAANAATEKVQAEARRSCDEIWTVVHGLANGLKHPSRLVHVPGSEESMPAFAFDTPGAGWDEGRWDVPDLKVRGDDADTEVLFPDACAQQVLAAFVCAYPRHLGGIALSSFMDPGLAVLGLAVERTWLRALTAWATGRPEVAKVWLFGSRAKGPARPDSDIDLGFGLVRGELSHDWPLGNWMALGGAWQDEVRDMLGYAVSLEAFSRPGEAQSEEEATERARPRSCYGRGRRWHPRIPNPCRRGNHLRPISRVPEAAVRELAWVTTWRRSC